MSEPIALQIVIPTEDIQKLLNKLRAITRADVIKESLYQGGIHIGGWIKDKRLSGPRSKDRLGVISNRLRSSITTSPAEQSGDTFSVKIGTNVVYAPIHEFGGVIHKKAAIRTIWFKKFKSGKRKGRLLFSKEKNASFGSELDFRAHDINMPARPFLRPGLEDEGNRKWVLNNLRKNISKAISEAK